FYLPGSEVEYGISWRNLDKVQFALYPLELTRDVSLQRNEDWLASVDLAHLTPSAQWTFDTHDEQKHEPGQAQQLLKDKPASGAYVLFARAGTVDARALVLVSDAAVSVKAAGSKLLAWATEVRTGAPLANAELHLWQRWHDGRDWRVREQKLTTGVDGVALATL